MRQGWRPKSYSLRALIQVNLALREIRHIPCSTSRNTADDASTTEIIDAQRLVSRSIPFGLGVMERDASISVDEIEPLFRIADASELAFDTTGWECKAADFMTFRVARLPGDLRNHVQRILHQIDRGDAEGTYGALLDLSIVLKDRGYPLRQRMLDAARSVLNPGCYRYLRRRLEKGITELDPTPPSETSVLSRAHQGRQTIVTKIGDNRAPEASPLDLARSHIEYGQLDAARSVLEREVLTGSLEQASHEDLIEIYIRTGDKANFLATQRQLNYEYNASPVLSLWREFEAFFRQRGTA